MFAWPTRKSGVSFSGELEFYLAGHWWGYEVGEWEAIPQEEQETAIAVYRSSSQIEAVLAEPRYQEKRGKGRRG